MIELRPFFPALARVHKGHPVAYFDGPGGTQVPSAVVDVMADYLLHHNANTPGTTPPVWKPTPSCRMPGMSAPRS